uniref:Radiation-inducible immediate-early gene IEX-1 n=1 Tax=Nothoprocta perdicaria TaxID=30464 RepID=A0A8C6Z162_NOTPE
MLCYTGERVFSSTHLLKSTSEGLSGAMVAVRAAGNAPGLPTKRSRKARKVLYPARVRKYLPRQEKDLAKRWLLVFAGIILMQVLTEDLEQERLAGEQGRRAARCRAAAAALPPAPLGAAANSSGGHGALSEAPGVTFSSAFTHQPLAQTAADVPLQARRQAHGF